MGDRQRTVGTIFLPSTHNHPSTPSRRSSSNIYTEPPPRGAGAGPLKPAPAAASAAAAPTQRAYVPYGSTSKRPPPRPLTPVEAKEGEAWAMRPRLSHACAMHLWPVAKADDATSPDPPIHQCTCRPHAIAPCAEALHPTVVPREAERGVDARPVPMRLGPHGCDGPCSKCQAPCIPRSRD